MLKMSAIVLRPPNRLIAASLPKTDAIQNIDIGTFDRQALPCLSKNWQHNAFFRQQLGSVHVALFAIAKI